MTNILEVNLKFLSLIGIWSPERKPYRESLRFLTWMAIAISVVIPQTVYAVFYAREFWELTECLTPISSSLILLLKMLMMQTNKKRLRNFIKELNDRYNNETDERFFSILKNANKESNTVVKCYFILLNYIVINYCWVPVLVMLYKKIAGIPITSLVLPVKVEYGLNQTENPTYAFVYFLITFGMTALTFMYSGVDCLFVSMSLHVAANLKIIRLKIKDLGKGVSSEEEAMDRLKVCVAEHCAATRNVYALEEIFTYQMVVNYLSNSFTICLVLFQASLNFRDVKKIMIYAAFSVGQFVQLYMFSRYGQAIMDQSELIAEAAYSCSWINYGKSFRKTLMLLIQKSQMPLGVTAAKFYYISIESFSKILSAAVSYFTLLRALNEEK